MYLLLTVLSGPAGDLMQGSEERGRSASLQSVSSRGSTQGYLDEGINAVSGFWPSSHHCLRHGHLPNSCGRSHVLRYRPCLLGSGRSTHDQRAWPGEAALPNTGYSLTSGKINRLQQMYPAGNFTLEKHHPHC